VSWVIGASSILGTGALVSDTRVRFADGTAAELLRKAYVVGNYIAAGFAGSVQIGFQMIASLADALAVPKELAGNSWDLRLVAPQWAPAAQRIFQQAPEAEQSLGCQLVLVGASPAGQSGSPFPRIDVARLAAPEFTPRFSSGLSIRHVGRGDRIVQYRRSVRSLFRLGSSIRQAHVIGLHEWARQVAFGVTIGARKQLHTTPAPIKDHLHVIAVRLGDLAIYTNDMTTYAGEGPPMVLKMPPVAHSWEQFTSLARAANAEPARAAC
jgi:hypothetical protein